MISVSSDYSRSTQTSGASSDTSDDPSPAQPAQPTQDSQDSQALPPSSQSQSEDTSGAVDSASDAPRASSDSANADDAQSDQAAQDSQAASVPQDSQQSASVGASPVGTHQQLSLSQPLQESPPVKPAPAAPEQAGAKPLPKADSPATAPGASQVASPKPSDGTQQQLSLSQSLQDSPPVKPAPAASEQAGAKPLPEADPPAAAPGASQVASPKPSEGMTSRELADSLVRQNDAMSAGDRFTSALDGSLGDMKDGKDTTDHLIAAGKAYNEWANLNSTKLTSDQQDQSNRLTYALEHPKDNETLESLGKRAKVDLTPLSKNRALDDYNKYGKLPSTLIRAAIFDEGRFNNSQVLKNTPLSALQRPGKSVLDPIGQNGRVGILLGTRGMAAASNFTKAGSMFMSGIQKMKDGKNPVDDFVGGSAAAGQGLNEITAGAATDFGNYLVKQRQLAQGRPTSAEPRPSDANGSHTEGTSTPKSASTSASDDNRSIQDLNKQIDTELSKSNSEIDEQVADRQKQLEELAFKKIGGTNRDAQPLALQDSVSGIFGEYSGMSTMGDEIKKTAREDAQKAHDNLLEIDSESQTAMRKLNDLGFQSVEAARASGNTAALDTVGRLDNLGRLQRDTYDQFNRAMNERETLINDAVPAFRDLGDALHAPTQEARQSSIAQWTDKYGEKFGKFQDSFLSHTDSYPDWFKISKPLRAQLAPSLIGTAFGAAGFGASLHSYLQKQAAGTLTTEDKINLGAQVFNLVGGAVGFAPVVGPIASIICTTVGAIMTGFADGYKDWQQSEAQQKLLNGMREEWNTRHPDQEIAEPFDGG